MDLTERFANDDEEIWFAHSGTPHEGATPHSGRYAWGSGKVPFQHAKDLITRVEQYKAKGMSETEIAQSFGLSTTQLRTQLSLAKSEQRSLQVSKAKRLREKGYSLDAIAREMGFNNDSSVRTLLNEDSEARMNASRATAETLKKYVDELGMLDVGAGVERKLGCSKEKLKEALYVLELQGYNTYGGRMPQVTNRQQMTTLKVLCKPGIEHKEIFNFENVKSMDDIDNPLISKDGGASYRKSFEYPSSLDSKRIEVIYRDQGGLDRDGLVEIRPGVKDLSLGTSNYAQVRIMVDGKHYIKGMAVYNDKLPEGVDVRVNSNKPEGTPLEKVLKPIQSDPDNPFGALIKEKGGQSYYDDPKGKYTDPITGKKQSLSPINKTREEGDWADWSDKVPAQFLAKQNIELVRKQLKLTADDAMAEFKDIKEVNNPTVKRALLMNFANDCDSAAVNLKAASFPRQKYNVILPLPSIKETEVYAPNYENGEKVALIRFPHEGTYQIPILTVNNNNREGKRMITSRAADAIGINQRTAEILSGADFDGDTVQVIPLKSADIKSTKPLEGLRDFDDKLAYPYREGMKVMKKGQQTQTEMGKISNLITDMTIAGATEEELARATRHSMTVIDAAKHKLDYKRSEKENGIKELKEKYQGRIDPETGKMRTGASTLISKANSEIDVPKRQGSARINPDGSLSYKVADKLYYTDPKTGKQKMRTQKSTWMAETNDAMSLVSKYNTKTEIAYAQYANHMKLLANEARKEMLSTGKLERSPSAAKAYAPEVKSLNDKLAMSELNAPKERRAQIIANSRVAAKKEANPDLTKKEISKIEQQELTNARAQVGAKRVKIEITDKEWNAIQAGAVSDSVLTKMLKYTDIDDLRKRATPRKANELSPGKIARLKQYASLGYTNAEIANALGISASSVSKYLNE